LHDTAERHSTLAVAAYRKNLNFFV
jgi:hypothetical protein